MPLILVANISDAPWLVKKLIIPSTLEELHTKSNVPMIYDENGAFIASLNLQNTPKRKYFAYLLNENGTVSKIYEGEVKDIANTAINKEEVKTSLQPLYNLIEQ
ncbi:MAG: hypothetical protein ACNI3C_10690 [Candidatus Marinarcus sp.]|uniref:hypothetical protein n=1 Tax=Candidatus Marinarcus sp. TaxID=3100987 RepID=UPI003B00446C